MKIIKNEVDYRQTLERVEILVDRDPHPGSPEADELEVLTLLIRDYENKTFPTKAPEPVEAIKFRMEQQNLTPRDLIPYIGSRSKVSEVLSGHRPLTMSMIRALHVGLGIPADVLIQNKSDAEPAEMSLEWNRFPLQEMIARGYFKETSVEVRARPQEILQRFLAPLSKQAVLEPLYKKSHHIRAARSMDKFALSAWTARVANKAIETPPEEEYIPGAVTAKFMEEIARLSIFDDGPKLAQEFLSKHGISLVIEPHLPRTHLDGAAILLQLNFPVIGMTLRHDRVDNFWFVLMHELVHIREHLREDSPQFFDDLDVEGEGDNREEEADSLAGEALIPADIWDKSPASKLRMPTAAEQLAKQLRIHPAIVAGRMRRKFNAYRLLSHMVGHGQVRRCFQGINWGDQNV